MVGNVQYLEDYLNNINIPDNINDYIRTREVFQQFSTIGFNVQAMGYAFPLYKGNPFGHLSYVWRQIDVFKGHGSFEALKETPQYKDDLKSNFEEHKEDVYTTLSGIVEQFSE